MNSIPIFIFLFFSYIQNIKSHNVACSSSYIVTPYSAYHCAGLNINIEGDTHCCFWNLTDSNNIVNTYCGSISDYQFSDLNTYIYEKKRKKNYLTLDIKCAEEERVYCSNPVLDEEKGFACENLKIPDKKDKYCCKWNFYDEKNNDKKMDFCASLSEYQYITIDEYINFKEEISHYDDLKIDCLGNFIEFNKFTYTFLLFLIIFLINNSL